MFLTMRRKISLPQSLTRPKRVLIVLILAVLFASMLFAFFYGLRVKFIVVASSQPLQLHGLTEIKQKNIVFLSENEVVQTIKKANPYVRTVSMDKQYPDTVILTVQLYTPLAALNVQDGIYILSSDGTLLERTKTKPSSGLPLITFYQKFPYTSYYPAQQIQLKEITTALFFVTALKEAGLPCDSIDIKSLDMIVCNVRNKTILFTSQKDTNVQKYELQTIIREFKIEGKDFRSLDVRFDKPVVTF